MSNANQMDLVHGRSAMWGIEAELLTEICQTPGDHIEIGTLWGASSIIAAKAKPHGGRLFAIDIMSGGYWKDGDPSCDLKVPTAKAILENFAAAGVAERITLICSNSYPLPITRIAPSTALIDGGHGREACLRDWESLKDLTSRFIAIHDYGPQHPPVTAAIDEVILADPKWKKYKLANSLLVMERIV